jgi:hypothetical protein
MPHGHLPEREIMTGIGPVVVRCPRVRDRVRNGARALLERAVEAEVAACSAATSTS